MLKRIIVILTNVSEVGHYFCPFLILSYNFSGIVGRIYNDRVEAGSASDSELEDVVVFEDSPSSSLDGTHPHSRQRSPLNGFRHDRHPMVHTKRKFFRSSLIWDHLQNDLQNKARSVIGSAREGALEGEQLELIA